MVPEAGQVADGDGAGDGGDFYSFIAADGTNAGGGRVSSGDGGQADFSGGLSTDSDAVFAGVAAAGAVGALEKLPPAAMPDVAMPDDRELDGGSGGRVSSLELRVATGAAGRQPVSDAYFSLPATKRAVTAASDSSTGGNDSMRTSTTQIHFDTVSGEHL